MNPRPIHRIELKENAKASMRGVSGLYLVSFVMLILANAPSIVIRLSSVGSAILNARTVDQMLYAYQKLMDVSGILTLVSILLNISYL